MINEGDGGNDLIESKRGIKHENMKFDFDTNLRKIMNDDEEENEAITLTTIIPRNQITDDN